MLTTSVFDVCASVVYEHIMPMPCVINGALVTCRQAEQQRSTLDGGEQSRDQTNKVIESSRRLYESEQRALSQRHDAHAEKLRSNRDFLNESAYMSRCEIRASAGANQCMFERCCVHCY